MTMTDGYVDHEILQQTADNLIEAYKEAGETFTPEREDQLRGFVAGLVDAEPPENELIWETIEVLMKTIEAKDRELALRAVSVFMLQFISGVDHTQEAFQCVPMLFQVKDAIKAQEFPRAGELLMAFLNRARALTRSR
jgi:hypothetical protein